MSTPEIGSVVRYHRIDGEVFNALVTGIKEPNHINIVYVNTFSSTDFPGATPFITSVDHVEVVVPGLNGFIIS